MFRFAIKSANAAEMVSRAHPRTLTERSGANEIAGSWVLNNREFRDIGPDIG